MFVTDWLPSILLSKLAVPLVGSVLGTIYGVLFLRQIPHAGLLATILRLGLLVLGANFLNHLNLETPSFILGIGGFIFSFWIMLIAHNRTKGVWHGVNDHI